MTVETSGICLPDFAGTSVDFLPTQQQVPKLTCGTNAVSESVSLASAFITSPVIRPTGFVYYRCIMTMQQDGHGWGSDRHCEHSPGSMSPYYNGPCNEIQGWVRTVGSQRDQSTALVAPSAINEAPLAGFKLFNHRTVK